MNGITGTSSVHHVVRYKVEKTEPKTDADAFAAAAAQGAGAIERNQVNNSASAESDERVNEAFAKMKVAMQNTPPTTQDITDVTEAAGQGKKSASQQFMDFMHLTPREKIRAGMLAELGFTQEEYNAMSPDDKAKIDKKIEEMEKKEAQQKIVEASTSEPTPHTSISSLSSAASGQSASNSGQDQQGKNKSLADLLAS
jgi:hypothetical protein